MKRKIALVLIIIILFNNIIPKFCYADDSSKESMIDVENAFTIDSYNSLNNDGSAEIRGENKDYTQIKETQTSKQTILVYLTTILDMLPIAAHTLMSVATLDGYENGIDVETQKANLKEELSTSAYLKGMKIDSNSIAIAVAIAVNSFTIDSLIRSEREMFDVNFFNFQTKSQTNNEFKESVATWYYTLRSLATIMSLLVLIYVGIRMAVSTTAIDRAKYKKMLLGWFESAIIIWLFPYILSIIFALSNSIMDMVNKVQGESFELTIIAKFYYSLIESNGYELILWSVAYWLLVWYILKFFITYAKRFLSVGLLIIISPLISVTYAIDKIGDGRAQGFEMLIKELIVNIFIQPLHLVIYIVFIYTANEIAKTAPILAIIFLASLSRVEKIVKNVFNMRGLTSIHSIGAIAPIKKKH